MEVYPSSSSWLLMLGVHPLPLILHPSPKMPVTDRLFCPNKGHLCWLPTARAGCNIMPPPHTNNLFACWLVAFSQPAIMRLLQWTQKKYYSKRSLADAIEIKCCSDNIAVIMWWSLTVPSSPPLKETEEEDAQSPTPEPESACGATHVQRTPPPQARSRGDPFRRESKNSRNTTAEASSGDPEVRFNLDWK